MEYGTEYDMVENGGNGLEFTTSLWQRSQSSYATTIPKEILAIKGAPTGEHAKVKFRINPETGAVELRFTEEPPEDDDE